MQAPVNSCATAEHEPVNRHRRIVLSRLRVQQLNQAPPIVQLRMLRLLYLMTAITRVALPGAASRVPVNIGLGGRREDEGR